ncbi:MAG: aspartyl protease family protein [Planctomycetota bacterium]
MCLALTTAAGAQTPIDGFLPMVGIALTDEFNDDFVFSPDPTVGTSGGNLLGKNGTPHFDLALLDTGAGFSLVTDEAFDDFGLGDPSPGESDGYVGSEFVTIGGATGQLLAPINDAFGLYASGLQDRVVGGPTFAMNTATLPGQTNTATITFPPDSPLPNVVGLPFASQYATHIRSDMPQIFEHNGRTVRTPAIEFEPLGSGGGEITRKAPLALLPGAAFQQAPVYLPNIVNFDIDSPQENPSFPTLTQGALFAEADVRNGTETLAERSFFFDSGASVTVLSEQNALALGFDVTLDEPEFTVAVTGSGGEVTGVPGFFVDEFVIDALGGDLVNNNVPVLVLDVTDPSNPGNIVEGIIGTNLLARRNVVIDPNPSLGAGGASAGLYVGDPVTDDVVWASPGSLGVWSVGSVWDTTNVPEVLDVVYLANETAGDQVAVIGAEEQAWEIFIDGGAAGEQMRLAIAAPGKLTTFSGTTAGSDAVVELVGGTLDTQYLEIRGGALVGDGLVTTGSGPIDGQVEVIDGVLAPGADEAALGSDPVGRLTLEGRLSLAGDATVEIGIGGLAAGEEHDQIVVDGIAALSGQLVVELIDLGAGEFMPTAGDRFELLSYEERGGEFDSITLPEEFAWDVEYGPTVFAITAIGPGIDGDFNRDGSVDFLDYTVWRDGLGGPYTPADYQLWFDNFGQTSSPGIDGDFNRDGSVDFLDYTVWRDGLGGPYTPADYQLWFDNFGQTSSPGAQVPEPATLLVVLLAGTVGVTGARRQRTAPQP